MALFVSSIPQKKKKMLSIAAYISLFYFNSYVYSCDNSHV